MVGASGFEPPASWSRTRSTAIPPFLIHSYLFLQSATYEYFIERSKTLNSCVVGTISGTWDACPEPFLKPQHPVHGGARQRRNRLSFTESLAHERLISFPISRVSPWGQGGGTR